MMLDKIKNFDPRGGLQVEDAIVLSSFARSVSAEYDALKVDKPSWLVDQAARIHQFVSDLLRDERRRKISELKSRRETLKTANERREELDKQIADLEAIQ